jgi:hypothetical protein
MKPSFHRYIEINKKMTKVIVHLHNKKVLFRLTSLETKWSFDIKIKLNKKVGMQIFHGQAR